MAIDLSELNPQEAITALYVGYFDRAPDPAGLEYWSGRLNAGMSLAEIALSFSVQPEATSEYPYLAVPFVPPPSLSRGPERRQLDLVPAVDLPEPVQPRRRCR